MRQSPRLTLVLLLVVGFSLSGAPSAHASKRKKSPAKHSAPAAPETYSATEEEGGLPPSGSVQQAAILAPVTPEMPAPRLTQVSASPAVAPIKPRLKLYPHAAPAATYDAIPSDQVDPMLKRIALVSQIAEKYARAYDYRTHTVHELETILRELDVKNAPSLEVPAQTARSSAETGDTGIVSQ